MGYLQLDILRQLSELTHRLTAASLLQRARYEADGAEAVAATTAKIEAEMFQSDLDYRQALDGINDADGRTVSDRLYQLPFGPPQ